MFYRVYARASDTRRKFSCTRKRVVSLIVHFAGAKCTGQMRQTRVRIRPSVPSLYYQTMQLPIGSAGSEFSRRASLQRALFAPASAFFSKRRSGLTPFGEWQGEELVPLEYDKRGGWPFFCRYTCDRTRRLITYQSVYFMRKINANISC